MNVAAANIDNAIKPLQKALHFTMKRIDDLHNVVPEGLALKHECETFQAIIVGVLDKRYLPINGILMDVNKTIEDAHNLIDDFIKEDNKKDRSLGGLLAWKIRKVYLARAHRRLFKSTTRHLELSKQKIHDTMALSAVVNKPTVHWYHGDMVNDASFEFWKEICGDGPYAAKWSIFTETYRQHYGGQWDNYVQERIRHVTCSHGDLLTVRGFITLTKLCGFPFDLSKLPELDDEHAAVPSHSCMEAAKMLNDLVIYNNSMEFRDQIQPLFTWYNGYNKWERNGKPWQDRANQWAEEMLKIQGQHSGDLDDHDGKLAMAVDNARRTFLSFFQRYVIIFKLGQLKREMFAEVDFPSMAIVDDFINHVKPLDYAHYHIVMGGDLSEWPSKQPKVYTFLDDYIKYEKKAKKKTRDTQASRIGQVIKALEESDLVDAVSGLSVNTNGPSQDSDVQLIWKL